MNTQHPSDKKLLIQTGPLGRHCRSFAQWFPALCLVFASHAGGEEHAGNTNKRETLISITAERVGGVTHLFLENLQKAEVTVTVEMELVNLEPNLPLPNTTTLSSKEKRKWLVLSPKENGLGWSWSYIYYSTFGSTRAEHDGSYVYSLPYAPGKAYRLSQGWNGEYSHFGSDQYALDWRMPTGTPVHAARGGTVVGLKNDSDIGGDDPKYDWHANYVLIRHQDGTLGQYVHLAKGGACVSLGQEVNAGDFIALSGNTGHSTGPHLHFAVFKARDGKHRQTVPIRFKTAELTATVLEEGKVYKAPASPAANSVSLADASRQK